MKFLHLLLTCVVIAALAPATASAQQPCSDTPPPTNECAPGIPLPSGSFNATPLIDGTGQSYLDPDNNKVSLYGAYGNTESTGAALTHYTQGTTLAQSADLTPRCTDGSIPPQNQNCNIGGVSKPPALIFLFIGFSNCDIEVCGGNSDIWDNQDPYQTHLAGQPCATVCPNLNSQNTMIPWNHVYTHGDDGIDQLSFLRQVYPDLTPTHWLVGPHLVVFNGALGQATLEKWDPTPIGYYAHHNDCHYNSTTTSQEECNFLRVRSQLSANGYSEKQVQAVFIKSSNSYPQCDLKGQYCATPPPSEPPIPIPDAYLAETYLGDILRYLKCCTLDVNGNSTGVPRYPNLKLVFVTSRIYGGYAQNPAPDNAAGCLNPEPFAYEEGFAVQRLIVAQIDRTTTDHAGDVRYPESAPWVDWGPYLWASGETPSNNGLFWCDGASDQTCRGKHDFRFGDLDPGYSAYWGDHTHPTADAAEKVANQLVKFIKGQLPQPQTSTWEWVRYWIGD